MLAGCAWDRLSQREKDTPLPLLQGFEDSVIVKFVPKQDLPSKTYKHRVERAAREALFSVRRNLLQIASGECT